MSCEFDDFLEDIAPNRILKAAAQFVASSQALHANLRHRARSILARMSAVGALQSGDVRFTVDRLTRRYSDALLFGKLVLRGSGTRISHGNRRGWCFLLRTPELVESGIRNLLAEHLRGTWAVKKRGQALSGTRLTLNPDMAFERSTTTVIGDVKYKTLERDWSRTDLYQLVAHAVGFRARSACMIGFCVTDPPSFPHSIRVGQVELTAFAWTAAEAITPEQAQSELALNVADWLERNCDAQFDSSFAS